MYDADRYRWEQVEKWTRQYVDGAFILCAVCCFTAAYYANPEIGSRDEKSRVKRERIERAKRKEE